MHYAVLVMMLLCFLSACGGEEKKQADRQPAPVRVTELRKQNVERTLEAIGNVRASASVGLVPRVAGEIKSINFKEGQEVSKGDPLLQIDPRPYEATLREKQAALAKSKAQLAKAQEDRRRYGKLVNNGYVSQEAFEQTSTDASALRATVQADEAAVESAALDLAYCTLSAPISGRIGALNIDPGNMVKSGMVDPIVSIDAFSPCYVNFSIAEIHLPTILDELARGPLTVTATPSGGAPETGQLTLVDNNVDAKTGTIRLRATFPNENRKLWPGQFVRLAIPLGMIKDAIVAPSAAIQRGRDGMFIYIIDEAGKAQIREIEPLFENKGQMAIAGDVKAGDQIVVEGQVRLAPGMEVDIL